MDIFSLVARLTLDRSDYEQGIDDARKSAGGLAEKLGNGLKTAAKVGAAAVGAAATGITVLGKNAIAGFAEYEQLVGGVETLFKGSAGTVQQYAENAYKTAGLSANEYMATVTSFSASLLQSLGGDTAAAADLADQAITDMSDNANKMGTDMAAIQTAYNGFAKQNYTMLDNLKLGYGGTKQEMERLLADATKLSGVKYDISSYADIVNAIHVVQTELGITGTTAKEASSTIQGSVSAMKSAWANLTTALARDDADMEGYIDAFVDSAVTAGENLLPRIEQFLTGVGQLVERLAPIIAEKLPGIVEKVIPPLLSAATQMVQAVVQALPSIVQALIDVLPEIIDTLVSTLAEMSPQLVELAVVLIVALAEGLVAAIPVLVEKAPEIIGSLLGALLEGTSKLLEAGVMLIAALAKGIVDAVGQVVTAIGRIGEGIFDGVRSIIDGAWNWGKDLIDNFTEGIKAFIHKPIDAIGGLADKIKGFLGFSEPEEGPLSNFHTFAPDMMELFAKGITDNAGMITDAIGSAFNLGPQIAGAAMPNGGREFEVPRSNASGQSATRPIVLVLDGREVARGEVPYILDEINRMGISVARG